MDVEGAIIERISGEKFGTFVDRHILAPLNMKDSSFIVPAEKRKRLATLYKNHLETTGGATDGFETEPGFASVGGGLVTTARDYARIGQMLLNHGTLDGVRVLSASAAQAIMTDHLAPALVTGGYGTGFQRLRLGYQYGYNGVVVTPRCRT
jgi:CubicO group peptidase (beta-lactamase class C family)